MNRKGLLLGASGALAFPSGALGARKRGDGYETIPYKPYNTRPFFRPGKELLANKARIDPLIWPAVKRINESGWVWTAESCQGGHGWYGDKPMLRLVCRSADLNALMGVLYGAARPARPGEDGPRLDLVRNTTQIPRGWAEFRIAVSNGLGLAYFERVARSL